MSALQDLRQHARAMLITIGLASAAGSVLAANDPSILNDAEMIKVEQVCNDIERQARALPRKVDDVEDIDTVLSFLCEVRDSGALFNTLGVPQEDVQYTIYHLNNIRRVLANVQRFTAGVAQQESMLAQQQISADFIRALKEWHRGDLKQAVGALRNLAELDPQRDYTVHEQIAQQFLGALKKMLEELGHQKELAEDVVADEARPAAERQAAQKFLKEAARLESRLRRPVHDIHRLVTLSHT